MEYSVVTADDVETLVEMVNENIAEGWKPLGGVSVAATRDQGYGTEVYSQAMTRG